MTDLTAAGFAEFFRQAHGHDPFPWQQRLTEHVLADGRWPDVIDIPTGCGKTAVLDTAIYALAARPDVFPRRIVFVIDRRIVVDQVLERAQTIATAIRKAANGSVAAEVSGRLFALWGGPTAGHSDPLEVAALRGGIPRDTGWAERPDRPAVMVSTVDQFGSRFLFRGYGTSPRMRPIHAGLAGNDCLVILDEVHLARPFAQTLREASSTDEIPQICAVNGERLPRRFAVVDMSATPATSGKSRLELQEADLLASEPLRQRAEASKVAILREVKSGQEHAVLPSEIGKILNNGLNDHERSVGVIVNRVRTARAIYELLCERGYDTTLLTGRMRPLDRAQALADIDAAVDPNRPISNATVATPRKVVVATQCIEVGADFSFDVLISEVAPADSLRQRLGRLDRRGQLAHNKGQPARCFVLAPKSNLGTKPDPIYGETMKATWEQLNRLPVLEAESGQEVGIDLSPRSSLWKRFGPNCKAPHDEPPLLLPTHIDALVQTNPEPHAQPPIDLFLHGVREREPEPEVSVCWRFDRTPEALRLIRPRPAEMLSVSRNAARSWLAGDAEVAVADAVASVEMEAPSREQGSGLKRFHLAVRYTGKDGGAVEPINGAADIKRGDTLVVDPSLGGLAAGSWSPSTDPSPDAGSPATDDDDKPVTDTLAGYDLGDAAQWEYDGNATLRLDPRLDYPVPPPLPSSEASDERTRDEIVGDWLNELATHFGEPTAADEPDNDGRATHPALVQAVNELAADDRLVIAVVEPPDNSAADLASLGAPDHSYYVLRQRKVTTAALDGPDDAASFTSAAKLLADHLSEVGAEAEAMARRLGVDSTVAADLRLAGEIHDLGKVDPRFQRQMRGYDDPVAEAMDDRALAKSLPNARPRRDEWPPVRHELSSVLMAEACEELLESANDPDLVLHLVGSHHGYSRPLPTFTLDDDPKELRFTLEGDGRSFELNASTADADPKLAMSIVDRFWRVHHRYGHHGVAWLEAILRLADHRCSAEDVAPAAPAAHAAGGSDE